MNIWHYWFCAFAHFRGMFDGQIFRLEVGSEEFWFQHVICDMWQSFMCLTKDGPSKFETLNNQVFLITGTFFQCYDYNPPFSVAHFTVVFAVERGGIDIVQVGLFLKHQTCWWLNEYVRVFLHHQSNSADVCWIEKGCFYQHENGCIVLLEFIFVGIHWNMVILVLPHTLSTLPFLW